MIKVKKKKVLHSAAYRTKSYTLEEVVSIPYEFVCEKCKETTYYEYKIRKHLNYTVMTEKTKDNEFVELPLPKEIEEETYAKFDRAIQNEIEVLQKNISHQKYHMLQDHLCSHCQAPQSWKAKYEYRLNLIFAFLISLLIIGCGALVGLILDNALYNLARSIHIDFIQNLMNNGTLFGALIGVIVAIIYLLRHWAKLDDLRYQTENVEKKEKPILHFDQMRIEKKTYQLLKEDRLK